MQLGKPFGKTIPPANRLLRETVERHLCMPKHHATKEHQRTHMSCCCTKGTGVTPAAQRDRHAFWVTVSACFLFGRNPTRVTSTYHCTAWKPKNTNKSKQGHVTKMYSACRWMAECVCVWVGWGVRVCEGDSRESLVQCTVHMCHISNMCTHYQSRIQELFQPCQPMKYKR